jgi:Ca2+-binding RTX toxin-like protein
MNLLHLFTAHAAPHKKQALRNSRTLLVENLEDRRLCALPAISFNPGTGVLVIQGTSGNDSVAVNYDPQLHKGYVSIDLGNPKKAPAPSYPFQGTLNKIEFCGNAGNDTFKNNTDVPCFADGGAGQDTLYGGGGADILFGGSGNDRLYGRGGNDSLYGHAGADYLDGGDGDDVLVGGYDSCKDEYRGGSGHDMFFQYYGPHGLELEQLDDYQLSEDVLQILPKPGWSDKSGKAPKIPEAGSPGSTPPNTLLQ